MCEGLKRLGSRLVWVAWVACMAALGCVDNAAGPPTVAELRRVQHEPTPTALRRLTAAQYRHAVEDLFGPGLQLPTQLEPDAIVGGFTSIGAATAPLSPKGVELYERAAMSLSAQIVSDPARMASLWRCEGTDEAACAQRFIAAQGRRCWRRPLTADEQARLEAIWRQAAQVTGSAAGGARYVLAALLQSPSFVFRVELGHNPDKPGWYDAHELATRLAFTLWDTTPDDALLDAADSGALMTEVGLRREVRRLMADPRARRGVRQFFAQLYELERLDHLVKAPELFPHISPTLGHAAAEETLGVIERVVFDERADWRTIFTTRETFINRELAALYELPAPAREGFAPATLPATSERVGVLGHVSLLASQAHPVSTSPTLRGRFIRKNLLCQVVPPPPAGVDTSIPPPSGQTRTLRERLKEHLEDPACAACHSRTDPLGLGMERFDGIGRYRVQEAGVTLDATGSLDGAPFDGLAGLGQAVAAHPELTRCLVRHYYRWASGKQEQDGQLAQIDALVALFEGSEHDMMTFIEAFVMSPAFRQAQAPEVSP